MRRLHEQEREAQRRDMPVATAAPVSRAARMIALQRTAGNHAVAAMLAREAKPKQEAPAHAVAFVSGIGSIPLLSFSLSEIQRGSHAHGSDREKPAKPPPQDVNVMSKQGDHSSALGLAYSQGQSFEVEVMVGENLRLKLHKAMISAYSVGDGHGGEGPVESWTLNAESIEFITDADKR